MDQLAFRQVHLDFHTSEAIPTIGRDWDKGHFQQMLQLGHVNAMNIFAKCHHGWSYHPTQVPLSEMHPNLTFDMLGAMIEAAHEIGVKVPAYLSAGLDEKVARTHTHWLRRMPDGGTTWVGHLQDGFHELCMRSPYLDYLVAQVEEVTRNYDADGIFLDIVGPRDCTCQYCAAEMIKRGLDPRDPAVRKAVGVETYLNYAHRINDAIRAIKPDMRIFHNSGHIARGNHEFAKLNTQLELESLPTGGWGYDHFPLSARYVQAMGMEYVGMTGKFHTNWGEFGGYKHPNALRFEAALSLANGAKMCVGDQMHPFGKLDKATYALIGAAYAEVETKEPWCHDVASIADVGVLSLEAVTGITQSYGTVTDIDMVDGGVVRVLQEGGILYDVLDVDSDFTKYQVMILPDAVTVDAKLKAKLEAYLAGGGKIFATGDSALDAERGEFALDFGVKYRGVAPGNPGYIVPRFPLEHWENTAFVIYAAAKDIEATTAEVLADRQEPFFNRDYLHFSSHQHTPNTMENAGPMMTRTANTVYLAIPAFQLYAEMGQNVLRDIVLAGIHELLTEPTLETSLPAQGVQTVMRQGSEGRTIIHLLYGSPIRRGKSIEVIEDLPPMHDVQVALKVDKTPTRVYLAPQQTDLPFTYENGIMNTVVPKMECHQMVVVE